MLRLVGDRSGGLIGKLGNRILVLLTVPIARRIDIAGRRDAYGNVCDLRYVACPDTTM